MWQLAAGKGRVLGYIPEPCLLVVLGSIHLSGIICTSHSFKNTLSSILWIYVWILFRQYWILFIHTLMDLTVHCCGYYCAFCGYNFFKSVDHITSLMEHCGYKFKCFTLNFLNNYCSKMNLVYSRWPKFKLNYEMFNFWSGCIWLSVTFWVYLNWILPLILVY